MLESTVGVTAEIKKWKMRKGNVFCAKTNW